MSQAPNIVAVRIPFRLDALVWSIAASTRVSQLFCVICPVSWLTALFYYSCVIGFNGTADAYIHVVMCFRTVTKNLSTATPCQHFVREIMHTKATN